MRFEGIDDWDLVALCREGLQEAFNEIVRRHYALILNICHKFLQDNSIAVDAVQEVFLKAYEQVELVKRGERPYVHWLCRVASNHSRNLYRRRKLEKRIFTGEETDFERHTSPFDYDALESMEIRESVMQVNRALRTLKSKERLAYILSEITDFSIAEIAEILRMPQYTVRRRIAAAREKILKILRQEAINNEAAFEQG